MNQQIKQMMFFIAQFEIAQRKILGQSRHPKDTELFNQMVIDVSGLTQDDWIAKYKPLYDLLK